MLTASNVKCMLKPLTSKRSLETSFIYVRFRVFTSLVCVLLHIVHQGTSDYHPEVSG